MAAGIWLHCRIKGNLSVCLKSFGDEKTNYLIWYEIKKNDKKQGYAKKRAHLSNLSQFNPILQGVGVGLPIGKLIGSSTLFIWSPLQVWSEQIRMKSGAISILSRNFSSQKSEFRSREIFQQGSSDHSYERTIILHERLPALVLTLVKKRLNL